MDNQNKPSPSLRARVAEKIRTNKKDFIRMGITLLAVGAVVAVLAIIFWDMIVAVGTIEGRAWLRGLIDGSGFLGWLVTLGIQVLQIVVAILPGEPVELMLGFMWGPWLGTLTCLLGILIGTLIVFFLARLLGKPFVRLVVGEEDERRYKFLHDPMKLDMTVFILFFIPGTPKDVLTYLVPLTPINPIRYFLIATFARIPSVVTSTVLGDSVMKGDYALAVGVFILTALISIGGIWFGNRYIRKRNKQGSRETKTEIIKDEIQEGQ